jgi:hypothetical protein
MKSDYAMKIAQVIPCPRMALNLARVTNTGAVPAALVSLLGRAA